jgi:hypothetical protein
MATITPYPSSRHLKRLPLFAALCLAHAVVIVLLIASSRFAVLRLRSDETPSLTLLELPHWSPPTAEVRPHASPSRATFATRKSTLKILAAATPVTHEGAPEVTGPVDWAAEIKQVARESVERQSPGDPYRAFATHPRGIAVPKADPTQSPGASQPFDGGEVITWVSEKCFLTDRGILPEPFSIIPGTQMLCKNPPRRD